MDFTALTKIILFVALLSITGCDASNSSTETDVFLGDYSYTIEKHSDDSDIMVATIEYNITLHAEDSKDVVIDFYLLPVDEEISNTSVDSEEEEIDENSYSHLYREQLEQLSVGENTFSVEIEFSLDSDIGKYEIVPVIDPLNEHSESGSNSGNYPDHIAYSEPTESSVEGEMLIDGDISYIHLDSSDVSVIEITETIQVTTPENGEITNSELFDSALLLTSDTDKDLFDENLFDEHYIGGRFSLNSDTEFSGKFYLFVSFTLWGDDELLRIWNNESKSYGDYQTIELDAIQTYDIDYELEISAIKSALIAEQAIEMADGAEDGVYKTEFILTLCDSEECDEGTSNVVIKNSISIPTYVVFTDNTPILTYSIENTETEEDFDPLKFSWKKTFGSESRFQAEIMAEAGAFFGYRYDADDDDLMLGISLVSAITSSVFNKEFDVLAVEGEAGLTMSREFGKSVEINALGYTIYTLDEDDDFLQDCSESNPCDEYEEDESEGLTKEWETTKEAASPRYFIGPVPVRFEVGFTGTLAVGVNFGFDGQIYIDGDLVSANLNAYVQGGVDTDVFYVGLKADLTIIDTTLNARAYIAPWDNDWNWNPTAGIQATVDLTSINGTFSAVAEVKAIKWCKKKIWRKTIKYPCGTKTKEYTKSFYTTKSVFDYDDFELYHYEKDFL